MLDKKHLLNFLMLIVVYNTTIAQRIKYSDTEKEDGRQMNFELVGKIANNIIVYKNIRTDNYFSVYDNDMKLKEKIKLTNLPIKLINVDFVAYPNYFYLIFQHQKKKIVYCDAIKYDMNGKMLEDIKTLDTTSIPIFDNNNKIYNVVVSDNKKFIGIIKANKKNERNHILGKIMYDQNLQQAYKRFYNIAMDGKNNYLSEFTIDNDGDIFMAKCFAASDNAFVNRVDILHIPIVTDTIVTYNVKTNERLLDEIKLKMDNANKKLLVNAFYFTKKRGNIEGYFINAINKTNPNDSYSTTTAFSDTLRLEAKDVGTLKTAFNDFFIRQIYPRKDGGFIATAESYYYSTRNNGMPFNRFDYFGNTSLFTPFDFYNMGMRNFSWNQFDRMGNNFTTYYAENVLVLSFNKLAILEWSNVIHKSQKDDNTEDKISYEVIITGGRLHFLFNEKDRNDFLMNDNSISPQGQIIRHPTLKNLDRRYTLMPRYGKQISATEMVFPCIYKNYICFAKIEY